MRKKGFTLAEVLITLAIIGVVAALTIPTVVRNYQKQETITRLEKAYSALANTTNLAMAEYGPLEGWEIGENYSGTDAVEFVNKYMVPYLKVARNCGNKTTGDCEVKQRNLNATSYSTIGSDNARFFLNDGTLIYGHVLNSGTHRRLFTIIDVNGTRGPNTRGRDSFEFNYWIAATDKSLVGKIVPWCFECTTDTILSSSYIYGCTKSGTGAACSALIMRDSWQIRDGYPWN